MPTKATRHRFYYLQCPQSGEMSWFHSAMRPTQDELYMGVHLPKTARLEGIDRACRILAHDALEHDQTIKNPGVQELHALGVIYAHRNEDSVLQSEVWDVVRFMIESEILPNVVRLPNNRNDEVEKTLENFWDIGYQHLLDEGVDEEHLDSVWDKIQYVVSRAFCAGYNATDEDFSGLFDDFQYRLSKAFNFLNSYEEYGEGTCITLDLKDLSDFKYKISW